MIMKHLCRMPLGQLFGIFVTYITECYMTLIEGLFLTTFLRPLCELEAMLVMGKILRLN